MVGSPSAAVIMIVVSVIVFLIVLLIVLEIAGPAPGGTKRAEQKKTKPAETDGHEYMRHDAPAADVPAPQPDRPQSASTYQGDNFRVDKLGRGGTCRLCGQDTDRLYRFTLSEDGKNESADLCAKCCKKLIGKLQNAE